ncbi:MAG: transglycosylase SLT domain-containing protein [Variibacter sp.]
MRLLIATLVAFFFFPWSGLRDCGDCNDRELSAPAWTIAEVERVVPQQAAFAAIPADVDAQLDTPSEDVTHDVPALDVARAVEAFEEGLPTAISVAQICDALLTAASAHDLPPTFFIRLIWRESRFNPYAVSRAGAQGVAQFMPKVAAEFGLSNPFDPGEALPRSAKFLSNLYQQFGNLGLAAAAYNAGARRVQDWLAKRGSLPKETRDYVVAITGHPAERWRNAKLEEAVLDVPARVPCKHEAVTIRVPAPEPPPAPAETVVAKSDPKSDSKGDTKSDKADGKAEKTAKVEKSFKVASADASAPVKAKKSEAADVSSASETRWLVQFAAEKSKESALKRFQRLKKHAKALRKRVADVVETKLRGRKKAQLVQVAFDTRAAAEKVCDRVKNAGETCTVVRD